MTGRAAQERANAREHFFHVEGLRHIIVGAGIEALHLLRPAVARGQNQHRRVLAAAAPGLQHGNPVHLRQAEIEDDRVIGFALAEIMRFLAVESLVDGIARLAQGGAKLAIEIGIVFDNEEAHGYPNIGRDPMNGS
jgi:hypothetical protein